MITFYNPATDTVEFISDTADETKPIEEVYTQEIKTESEEERNTRLWKAIQEFSSN